MKFKKFYLIVLVFLLGSFVSFADKHSPQYSTAGFYELGSGPRKVSSMNQAWRFMKGKVENAHRTDFDDSEWGVVALPHGLEYTSTEASGCTNYQGEAWYRKHFTPAKSDKRQYLYFEAIMGKSKVYLNGELLKEHFGGFLPVIVDVTDRFKPNQENVIAVWCDNSDDPMFPPGKPQNVLDFSYFGGIYRDSWLVETDRIFITDPNQENETASGGVVVAYDNVSDKKADVLLKMHLRNQTAKAFTGRVHFTLVDPTDREVAKCSSPVEIAKSGTSTIENKMIVNHPKLWTPDAPNLYWLKAEVKDKKGNIIDGYKLRVGVRSIEFRAEDGLWINGKPYPVPLIGGNRHQDFAVIGNALPNSIHWRDAKKLRDAGMRVIRNAHYPQDPAFMDACDELGLFVIVNTPGWQFWNSKPIFAERVYQNVRDMVRRDRNRASIFLWEPILNETWYPEEFAKRVKEIVEEEFPYENSYCACDHEARGSKYYDIQFTHPMTGDRAFALKKLEKGKTYFTREWGDNVDNWNSHNSTSRINRSWGEQGMLIQAKHYANPSYPYTSYESLHQTSRQHVGGTLWHSFDHQRGYHPDPFYGGLMDVFRRPKFSYYMFKAQRPTTKFDIIAESGPMVYIAHEMTPFSGEDVVVYSNCDEVRLTVGAKDTTLIYKKPKRVKGMPSPTIVFEDVYDFMDDKRKTRGGKESEVYLLAEGLIDGKVVTTYRREPARRATKIRLSLDNEGVDLIADGSDMVVVVAEMTDRNGNVKRLNNSFIKFTVEGEGVLVGGAEQMNNPRPLLWGEAPILLQSTHLAGEIKVRAEVLFPGEHMPVAGELVFESKPNRKSEIVDEKERELTYQGVVTKSVDTENESVESLKEEVARLKRELSERKLKEVERQQSDFEGGGKK